MIHGGQHFAETFYQAFKRTHLTNEGIWMEACTQPGMPLFPVAKVVVPVAIPCPEDSTSIKLPFYVPGWQDERGLVWICKSEYDALMREETDHD